MTSPPLAVRWTVRRDTRRWISAADGNGSAPGAAAPATSDDSSPAATKPMLDAANGNGKPGGDAGIATVVQVADDLTSQSAVDRVTALR